MRENYWSGIIVFLFAIFPLTLSQAPGPASRTCNGVYISYTYTGGSELKPKSAKNQPYRFESTLSVENYALVDLKNWQVFVGFQHDEILVSATNAVLADSSSLPAEVGNGTVIAGSPMTDLKTQVETAGDSTQTSVQVEMVGTRFGGSLKAVPFPSKIYLANDGYVCPAAKKLGSSMSVCCNISSKKKRNITVSEKFSPRRSGDLVMMYDVLRTYGASYWAQVTISNHNQLGRLDNWKLSWDWMNGEFINSMKGAYPYVVDSSGCIYGSQATYYQDIDFSRVLNCERRPTLIDLPPTKANDSIYGRVPNCCRNGTILPPVMDPTKSISAFQIEVYKMPPNLNRSSLDPPQKWAIAGTLNPDYQCGPPVRVSPSQFIDPSGLPSNSTAVSSWQVVCNITQAKGASPKCCVSFSAYNNDSAVPCNTCACGCTSNTGARTCNSTAPAMLLPPNALLVPFKNRTNLATAWASIYQLPKPNPRPCPDNCGVSINWHLNSNNRDGWDARITIFNWGEVSFADWFAAIQLNKAGPGFKAVYSFNGTMLNRRTLFVEGVPGLNYLVAQTKEGVPGKQQSLISFSKKRVPGLKVDAGDGYPSKVFFNGEECALPSVYPTSNNNRNRPLESTLILMVALAFLFTG